MVFFSLPLLARVVRATGIVLLGLLPVFRRVSLLTSRAGWAGRNRLITDSEEWAGVDGDSRKARQLVQYREADES